MNKLKKSINGENENQLPPIPIFRGINFYIMGLGFSETTQLKALIKSYGGDVAFQINKNVKYLLISKEELEKNMNSTKIQSAIKIPTIEILSIEFISHCIEKRYLPLESVKEFVIYDREKNNNSNNNNNNDNNDDNNNNANEDSIENIIKILKKDLNLNNQTNNTSSNNNNNNNNSTTNNYLNSLENIKLKKLNIKLFISSTFLDMEGERENIVKYLIPEIRNYCNDRNIEFSFVDLRWGLVENKDLIKKSTISTCLQEVSTSNYFISLVGNRYGWSSGEEYSESFNLASIYYPWIKEKEGKSITELEILQALKNKDLKSLHFYFKDQQQQQQSSTNTTNDQPKLIESIKIEENPEKLNQLKSYLKSNYNDKIKNYNQINSLISSIFKDLIKSIDSDLNNYQQSQLQIPLFKNINSNSNSLNLFDFEKNQSYLKSLLKIKYIENSSFYKLNSFIISNSDADESKPFIITSAVGFGKSTYISNWLSSLSSSTLVSSRNTLVVNFFIGLTINSKNRIELLRQLFSIIKDYYRIPIPLSENPEDFKEEVNYWFDMATKDGRKLIIIFDSIDCIEKQDEKEKITDIISQILPSKYPQNVKIVLSCYLDNYTEISEYFNISIEKNENLIQPLAGFAGEQEILLFAETYLRQYSKELDLVQTEILKKFSKSCKNPFFLSNVLGELVTIGDYKTLNEKLIMLLSTQAPLQFYLYLMGKWETDSNYPESLAANIVKLIYLSGNGLYEQEILSILGLKSSHGFFSQIKHIFTMGSTDNYYSILSPFLKIAIHLKYFNQPSLQADELKSKLVNYFNKTDEQVEKELQDLSIKDNWLYKKIFLKRKIEYLPRILMEMKDKSKLKEFLLDFKNLNLLSKSELGKINIVNYWSFIETNDKKSIVDLYNHRYVQYCNMHPPMEELALTTYNIGLLFEQLSMYEEAYTLIEKSQEYHIQLYGDSHRMVANDLKRLVLINIKTSKYERSEYQAEKLLFISEQLYGKENIGSVESLQLNGLIQKKKTQYLKSLNYYLASLKIIVNYLNLNVSNYKLLVLLFNLNFDNDFEVNINSLNNELSSDSSVVNSNNDNQSGLYFNIKFGELFLNIGDVFRKLGKFDISIQFYSKTLKIFNNLRKPNHPCFSELYKNLGLVYKKNGDYEKAVENYQKSLEIIRSNYGEQHVEYGLVLCDLADTKRKEEKYQEAQDLYYQSLEILNKKLNKDSSIEIAEIYNDLGLIKKKQSNYKEAVELYQKSIVIAQRSLGKSHLKISFFNLNLADCYRKIGDYKVAEQYYTKCLSITQENLGYDHIEVAEILNSIGLIYKKQGKYQQAEREYKRAIIIINKSLGNDHYKNGIYMNNLADIYRKVNNVELANTYYNKSLKIIEKSLGKEHSEYAEVIYCMGLLQLSLENYNKSIELINQAIEIIINHFNSSHVKVGIFKNSLAEAMIAKAKALPDPRQFSNNLEEMETVRQLFESSQTILTTEFGTHIHPEIADLLVTKAEFEFQFGSHSKSLDYFKEALEIVSKVYDENHFKYQQIYDRIRYF
ncbi:hypothetical protein DICPUDRAFT_96494 [Dictyostelium purpureum]|uniref:BRCT domain-containing protein n=1 Tax=Dictyostelium purpureum TaxID=5786 RepID=F0Z8S8_DICPU|nr:uncharacterized protein DICPUDRAFT_96494 [Dictyostelium purpureum]EGC39600.1 hypothetical protein DICPUDRAFT_96494 [Dictyostelium purpureum]|eukprot:XP_003283821.1 hypothetical protein DICPUDRAFT_96494 [Dictyostelium purpureum]